VTDPAVCDGLLPLMHWQKEDNCEAWSPEKQVQPTNKSREEETHVGTVMHYNHKAEQQKQLAKSKAGSFINCC